MTSKAVIHAPHDEPTSIGPKTVNIFINDDRYPVDESPLTGEQIATLGGVPAGNQLFLEVPGPGDDREIARDRTIEPRSGMRFYDVPAGNLG